MSRPADPQEIYARALDEGRRRMQMPFLEQVATGFIAGVTIVFGIVALGVTSAYLEPQFGPELAKLGGALAFGVGLVFLVVGRSELFSENFFDPVAAAIDEDDSAVWGRLGRLWITMLVLNLVGGAVLTAIMMVDGALPTGAGDALVTAAEELAKKPVAGTFARAILAGALVTLLSYMLNAANSASARVLVAYFVGVVLALGPFDHVVVSALHIVAGIWLGGPIGYGDLGQNIVVSTIGNVLGGLLLITLTHTAQVRSASGDSADAGGR